jgi:large-conductance mechanosensitive channel
MIAFISVTFPLHMLVKQHSKMKEKMQKIEEPALVDIAAKEEVSIVRIRDL